MSTLEYNEVRERRYIELDGEPYEVLASHVFRKQQRKPVNQTKLKNLITGKVLEHSFHQSDKVPEAEIGERPALYLYHHKDEYWFCDPRDKAKRFELPSELVAEALRFIKPNSEIRTLYFGERTIGVRTPIKVELKVKEAAPAVKGNTVQGGVKRVVLETGVELAVPMFVNEGDIVVVNSQTGEYVERVGKK